MKQSTHDWQVNMSRRLTDEERAEIRALFSRLADIQADDAIKRMEEGRMQVLEVDTGKDGDVWKFYAPGGHE